MEKIQILSIGRDPVLLQNLSRFINENPKWESTGTVDDEVAIEIFHQRKFDIILFIDNIEEASQKKLVSLFTFNDPEIIFIRHTGDATGLLAGEIQKALEKRRKPVNIIDITSQASIGKKSEGEI
ncbi:MAG: hypothetical protein ABI184_03785 [Ginsengibacter sp.]